MKITKTKIIVLAVALVLLVSAGIGTTIAYLTDTESANNVFTVGSVDIVLNEQQRALDADGVKTDELEAFEQSKVLLPIVGSAQGEKQEVEGHGGLPTASNYVDKIANITNDGDSDAYVRFYFAIPSALDDGYETFNASINALHFNFGNDDQGTTYGRSWIWTHGNAWNYYETTIDDVEYNVYYADYATVLAAGETTTDAVQGVYLDARINVNEAGNLTFNGTDLGWGADEEIVCPVFAVATQAAGFSNTNEAITAAFGANYNPWGGASSNWQ